jgi:hypothetical protein
MNYWIVIKRCIGRLLLLYLLSFGILQIANGFVLAQSPELLPGFPIVLDSNSESGYAPIVADFDNDNLKEILICYYQSQGRSKISLLRDDGSMMMNWPKFINDLGVVSAAGDVNNDGYIDIVIRSKDSLFVFDRQGDLLTGFPIFFSSGSSTSLVLYDFNNDGLLEIITTGNNKVMTFNSNGSIVNGWPALLPGSIATRVYPSPLTVSDIDRDNLPEVIVPSSYCTSSGCDSSFVNIFNADGSMHSISPIVSDSGFYYTFAPVSVIKNDGTIHLLVNSSLERNDIVTTRTRAYNQNGVLERVFYSSNFINTTGPISIAGSQTETSNYKFSFGYQGTPSFLLNANFSLLPGWPVSTNSHSIRSINMFGIHDKTFLMTTEKFADTSGGFKETYGYIRVFNESGVQTSWSPIRSRGIPVSAPVICDLNNDGIVDIVSVNDFYHGSLVVGKIVYAWTLPWIQYNPSKLYWPMYAHDRYRTNQYGFIPPDEPVGIQPNSANVPDKFSLHQNFPNPFNPVTTIKFDIRSSGNVSLKVYDILGREVAILVDEYLRAGSYERVFEASNLSSGVYFYTLRVTSGQALRADEFEKTLRMVVVR